MRDQKPLIFVSHSSKDAGVAKVVKDWIDENLLGSVTFFVSTDQSSVPLGSTWYKAIDDALAAASVAVVIISFNSIDSPWIYFEAGAAAIRQIPVVPVCINNIRISQLPSPLNQFQAVELRSAEGQKKLLDLIAAAADIRSPKAASALAINDNAQFPQKGFDWKKTGILSLTNHSQAYEEFFNRIRSAVDTPEQVLISGASLTEIIHVGTMDIAKLAENSKCKSINIVIKQPDVRWSRFTARGMSFLKPYTYRDSYDMCVQTRQDVLKLLKMTEKAACQVEAHECAWPPTCTFVLLDYETYSWGFWEPIMHSVNLLSRSCFILFETSDERTALISKLRQSFQGVWNDSSRIST